MKRNNLYNKANPWQQLQQVLPGGKPSSLPFAVQAAPKKYCKRCGHMLLFCGTDSSGHPNYSVEEEMALGVCHECYPTEAKAIEDQLIKSMQESQKAMEPSAEEKKIADDKYEEAIKKYMEELRKRSGNNTTTDT